MNSVFNNVVASKRQSILKKRYKCFPKNQSLFYSSKFLDNLPLFVVFILLFRNFRLHKWRRYCYLLKQSLNVLPATSTNAFFLQNLWGKF